MKVQVLESKKGVPMVFSNIAVIREDDGALSLTGRRSSMTNIWAPEEWVSVIVEKE